ncbi:Hsp70-Hsp90 organizing protein 1 [Glycine max]|uniref:Hsp70-Hsp90 organizing protein 1 isoform C n=1 Tax=Glycine soja TaxID=3848 RepID=A0A445KJN7_GLYSO|nr:Hsp70-Hsp90 organizing protein 1 [Glycine max]RZC11123.1 Hsp70-Hsp90 organizing protein 1 isoform C [Glycine soja]
MAEEAKAKGNAAFSAGDFAAAVRHFTDAIALSPSSHVLYSNRSAAHASLQKYAEALADAQKTVDLKPDWPKAYSRLGAALLGLRRHRDAVSAYKTGLHLDPDNAALKSGLADAHAAASRPPPTSPFATAFSGPDMWARLTADPTARANLQDPEFVKIMQDIQKDPNKFNLHLSDQRVMHAVGVLLNVKIQTPNDDNADAAGDDVSEDDPVSQSESESEPEPEPEVAEEEKEARDRKGQAQKEKEAGNAAYKKKDFETAIGHYTKALELDDEDISYLTNRAAVYLEMGKFEDCIKDCEKAVERGRELRSDYKMIARALTRKGTALAKMAKCSKDFEPAIETFQKALTEHRNPDTLKKLNEAEKAKKELEQQEYFDPKLADEEREKGNELFKQQKYPEAIKHYTEAIKRNPKDAKAYSNRAACYTKLGAMPEGLKDAEKCIELDPTFSKGYTRKGAVQFFMKEYEKALETYKEGLKHDPNNQELLNGIRRYGIVLHSCYLCVEQNNKASRGDFTPEELKERQAKAMQDPEIQSILQDPVMRQVLTDFQENPRAAEEHAKNPMVMDKIQKLISAGIVQMR